MTPTSLLLVSAAVFSTGLAGAVVLRARGSVARWSFSVGMLILAAESACSALASGASEPESVRLWEALTLTARALVPAVWLTFSLTYSRGEYRQNLSRSRALLVAACLLPIAAVLLFQQGALEVTAADGEEGGFLVRLGTVAKVLNAAVLVGSILIMTNLERTFRAAVGTMRWRIKYLVLGLGLLFATRIYTASQTLLFSRHDAGFAAIEAAALLMGCILITIAYLRSGWSDVEIYPSRTILQSSVTVMVAGAYLFVIGVFAQVVAAMGGARHFQAQALIVILGVTGLAALLLSDRLREKLQRAVSRHFKRPQHDSQKVWTLVTERLARLSDEKALATGGAQLISETFHVLSVTVWLLDEHQQRLALAGSTSQAAGDENPVATPTERPLAIDDIAHQTAPFDVEAITEAWGEALRAANPPNFQHGGKRLGVPLISGTQWLGLAVLADRVSGVPYTPEEVELLQCIADQLAASLLNLRLAARIARSRELEAFQTVSAFFVHDLKNAASSLNLTLRNMPIHFDDPSFRADALRAISSTVDRINSVTSRLGLLRGKLELNRVDLDLNELIREIVATMAGTGGLAIETTLASLPRISGDRERLHSVLTNLLLNARDALGGEGKISVETAISQDRVLVTVGDNGSGMTPEFLRDSLFRPFQTTKKEGIGIGMFQTKTIVEAHGGTIQVESEQGKGSTFRVRLPIMEGTQ